ncbi:MAG: AraC family transcriptional regulator [Gammaproteobacteria bacterium]|nr:AraC family transcriptional regulator [Gammaproteobacteria bacterium]
MNIMSSFWKQLVGLILMVTAVMTLSAQEVKAEAVAPVDQQVQDLKRSVLSLNRELFVLEEELLFPANTQLMLFLSMDVGKYFSLDSVEVTLDGKELSSYLYTPRETDALLRGGVQRFYIGNLKSGEHELVAVFTGKGPSGRDYRRAASLEFDKGLGAKFVELKISDRDSSQQPEFVIREWE